MRKSIYTAAYKCENDMKEICGIERQANLKDIPPPRPINIHAKSSFDFSDVLVGLIKKFCSILKKIK